MKPPIKWFGGERSSYHYSVVKALQSMALIQIGSSGVSPVKNRSIAGFAITVDERSFVLCVQNSYGYVNYRLRIGGIKNVDVAGVMLGISRCGINVPTRDNAF